MRRKYTMKLSVAKLRQILQITPKVSLVDENIKILVENTKPHSKGNYIYRYIIFINKGCCFSFNSINYLLRRNNDNR